MPFSYGHPERPVRFIAAVRPGAKISGEEVAERGATRLTDAIKAMEVGGTAHELSPHVPFVDITPQGYSRRALAIALGEKVAVIAEADKTVPAEEIAQSVRDAYAAGLDTLRRDIRMTRITSEYRIGTVANDFVPPTQEEQHEGIARAHEVLAVVWYRRRGNKTPHNTPKPPGKEIHPSSPPTPSGDLVPA